MRQINLLPKLKQQDLRYELFFKSLKVFFEVATITFLLVFVGQVLTKVYLAQQLADVNAQIVSIKQVSNKEENTALKAQIKLINSQITDYKNLEDAAPRWSKALRAFAGDMPGGVQVTSFTGDLSKKTIFINGTGKTRQAVIDLYNNVSADSQNFSNIDYPLENVAKPVDVPFHFTFTIQDSLLK